MKNAFIFIMTFFLFVLSAPLFAATELDSEISNFQVEIMSAEKYNRSRSQRPHMNQSLRPQAKVLEEAAVEEARQEEPRVEVMKSYAAPIRSTYSRSGSNFIQRVGVLPGFTISFFDGADDSLVSPQGMFDAYNTGLSGTVFADINLFNDSQLFFEGGLSLLSFGSDTGANYNFSAPQQRFKDQLKLTYMGLSLSGKWYSNNPNQSAIFAKLGATPMYQVSKTYNNLSQIYLTENRFGTISSFDMAIHAGAGYSYRLNPEINILADITFYQGLISTMSTYSVYNAGFIVGLGASYKL